MKHVLCKSVFIFIIATTLVTSGCGKEAPPPPPTLPESGPVSLEFWKTLPIEQKYDPVTLSRLREADPQLKSASAWKKFQAEVVKPEFDREVPRISPEEAKK